MMLGLLLIAAAVLFTALKVGGSRPSQSLPEAVTGGEEGDADFEDLIMLDLVSDGELDGDFESPEEP